MTRLKWKLVSIHLEIVLILTHDRCTVCVERTIGSEIILDAHDGTPTDVVHVESHFFQFGGSVSVGARKVHTLRQTYHQLRNRVGRTRWYSEVMRLK